MRDEPRLPRLMVVAPCFRCGMNRCEDSIFGTHLASVVEHTGLFIACPCYAAVRDCSRAAHKKQHSHVQTLFSVAGSQFGKIY